MIIPTLTSVPVVSSWIGKILDLWVRRGFHFRQGNTSIRECEALCPCRKLVPSGAVTPLHFLK